MYIYFIAKCYKIETHREEIFTRLSQKMRAKNNLAYGIYFVTKMHKIKTTAEPIIFVTLRVKIAFRYASILIQFATK